VASLKDIRRRIGSVKNTQQITKAMKLVSAAKLRRAQQAILGARPFASKLEEITGRILAEVLANIPGMTSEKQGEALSKLHPLLKVPSERVDDNGTPLPKRVALLVVGSDRGLCGAYNSNILKFSVKRRNELLASGHEVQLFFVGKRAKEYFVKRGMTGFHFEDTWSGRFNTEKSGKIAAQFVEMFLKAEVDAVEFCYTEFKSAISQTPMSKQILPLAVTVGEEGPLDVQFIYKPSREELLSELLPKQVQTQVYKCLADSLASEFGARMTSMDNATKNASDMISRLTLEANRVRQAAITKELMEIIGGAEALKG
jgi:F-type H+-transporting ATPase subunit gamma